MIGNQWTVYPQHTCTQDAGTLGWVSGSLIAKKGRSQQQKEELNQQKPYDCCTSDKNAIYIYHLHLPQKGCKLEEKSIIDLKGLRPCG